MEEFAIFAFKRTNRDWKAKLFQRFSWRLSRPLARHSRQAIRRAVPIDLRLPCWKLLVCESPDTLPEAPLELMGWARNNQVAARWSPVASRDHSFVRSWLRSFAPIHSVPIDQLRNFDPGWSFDYWEGGQKPAKLFGSGGATGVGSLKPARFCCWFIGTKLILRLP